MAVGGYCPNWSAVPDQDKEGNALGIVTTRNCVKADKFEAG